MTAIMVDGVTKRYRQYRDEAMLLKRLAQPHRSREYTELLALDQVTFEVARGTTLGVVGRNGSGKTTLLRLLSGVSAPTWGRVRVEGRIAPLIGIGVGFNYELTGRENVLVNGRLLGMTLAEVRSRFDRIVDFAELEEFIDVPVKFYSSGMFLRLAFAVAIHVEPDVLLVDEILAVGDVAFQAKCYDRMRELQEGGTTIVVVTHNVQLLQRLTPRAIVLDHGRPIHDGSTEDALHVYHEVMQAEQTKRHIPKRVVNSIETAPPHQLADVRATLVDEDGDPTLQVHGGSPVHVRIEATFHDQVDAPIVGFGVEQAGLGLLYAAANDPRAYRARHGPGDPLICDITLPTLPLMAGTYLLRAHVRAAGQEAALGEAAPVLFHVWNEGLGAGTVDLAPQFTIGGHPVPLSRPFLAGMPAPVGPSPDEDGQPSRRPDTEHETGGPGAP